MTLTPALNLPPLDLLVTGLGSCELTIEGQSERGKDYLSRVLEFHYFRYLAPDAAICVGSNDFDTWLLDDIKDKGLGLYAYAPHPETGSLELGLVVGHFPAD